jgi:hypothetical protein
MENQATAKEIDNSFYLSAGPCVHPRSLCAIHQAQTALDGIQTAFWLWLGFIATTQLATVVFEERKLGLYLINVGYQFVACALGGCHSHIVETSRVKGTGRSDDLTCCLMQTRPVADIKKAKLEEGASRESLNS